MNSHHVFVGYSLKHILLFARHGWLEMMICFTLFFIVILTTVSKVTSLQCSQLPASGDDHLQQVTTLQYCLVDDCTIMKIDTGDKLDIVYTTDSLIVTTPTDGHTSEVIARLENELPCLEPRDELQDFQSVHVIFLVIFSLLLVISGYIIAVHIMLKELRNLFGKLLMFYNVAMICMCISFMAQLLPLLHLVLHSLVYCYVRVIGVILSTVGLEALGTCLLHYIATIIHHSYKLRSKMSKETSQCYYKRYMIYSLGTTLIVLFLTICFDMATGNYKISLKSNGQCESIDLYNSSTYTIPVLVITINKMIQLLQFITYLYYIYKLNKFVDDAGVSNEYLSILHKTATALGAIVGLSHFAYILQATLNLDFDTIAPALIGLVLIQQSIVAAILMFTKKVRQLCRAFLKRQLKN